MAEPCSCSKRQQDDRRARLLREHQAGAEARHAAIERRWEQHVLDRLLIEVVTEAISDQSGEREPAEVAHIGLEADQLPAGARRLELVQRDLDVDPLADVEALDDSGEAAGAAAEVRLESSGQLALPPREPVAKALERLDQPAGELQPLAVSRRVVRHRPNLPGWAARGLEHLLVGQKSCCPIGTPRNWIVEYGLIGILVIILLVVMILYFVRRA
jgi:hypothetical protein